MNKDHMYVESKRTISLTEEDYNKLCDILAKEENYLLEKVVKSSEIIDQRDIRILKIDDDGIHFDNGKSITAYHYADCCEDNYADFKQVEQSALETTFQQPLAFSIVHGYGFRFGDERQMFFVPCYSDQNGYYSDTIDIFYDGKRVFKDIKCKMVESR